MNKAEAAAKAKPVFDKNPDMEALHFTSDGQVFDKKHNATIHAKELADKSIFIVKPGESGDSAGEEAAEAVEVKVKDSKKK